MNKPDSLTEERAWSLLPRYETNAEWQRKYDAGELPDGLLGMRGMWDEIWPDEKMTREEAEYVLWLEQQGSWRWLANRILYDDNQIYGMNLVAAARAALPADGKAGA